MEFFIAAVIVFALFFAVVAIMICVAMSQFEKTANNVFKREEDPDDD
jgi:hypothetical protein